MILKSIHRVYKVRCYLSNLQEKLFQWLPAGRLIYQPTLSRFYKKVKDVEIANYW